MWPLRGVHRLEVNIKSLGLISPQAVRRHSSSSWRDFGTATYALLPCVSVRPTSPSTIASLTGYRSPCQSFQRRANHAPLLEHSERFGHSTEYDGCVVSVALVGCGYWGPNLLRNLLLVPDCDVRMCCDVDAEALERIRKRCPSVYCTTDSSELLRSSIDAVVIATPAATHFELAKQALDADKHVMVEKPLALAGDHCAVLVSLARERNLILMVGHTFLFDRAVTELRDYVQSGNLGPIFYLHSRRLNLGRVRSDVNALWNLAPHDISISRYLLDCEPTSVSARGASFLQPGIEDVVFLTLEFPDAVLANVHVSWLDPLKVRQTVVVGGHKMAVLDSVNKQNPLAIYDSGIDRAPAARSEGLGSFTDFGQYQLLQRSGDVLFPKVDQAEPLRAECLHFIECVRTGQQPITSGRSGLHVVRVLEAATNSLRNGGKTVGITYDDGL